MLKQIIWLTLIAVVFGFISYQSVIWIRKHISWFTFVVQSGSMEPSIRTGDVIFIQKQTSYALNETITFKDTNKRTITHRIIEKSVDADGQEVFVTKGDANQAVDTETVPFSRVVGRVVWVIPKFGFVIQFGRTPWGFILFFIVPTIIILYDELKAIIHELRASVPGRSRRTRH